jgi:hypothetical protein
LISDSLEILFGANSEIVRSVGEKPVEAEE